jgi:signal recognition particle subunit SRP54
MIDSMTRSERINPKVIDQSRRRRIAQGAGCEPHEVNELVKQFDAMGDMMKKMASLSMVDRVKQMSQLGQSGLFDPGARLARSKQDTGKRLTSEEKARNKKQKEKDLRKKRRGGRDS